MEREAFERARSVYGTGAYDDATLEFVFPQLKESEDERITRAINNMLPFIPDEAYANNGVTKEGVLRWLEKQKESPKSADSIPADCVSDVKCEDRWHKVTDSLPDNPREVLCKDEAGNFFIGRYYVGEGWEISNYDDEDKPHHLNPPVSKWIDFPSEKHKESLHIMETCKENLDSFTDDDERIRKDIVALILFALEDGSAVSPGSHTTKEEALAYLEKQKEKGRNITANLLEDGITGVQRELIEFLANNIDASWVDIIKSADAYTQRIRSMVEKQKEQKPVEKEITI